MFHRLFSQFTHQSFTGDIELSEASKVAVSGPGQFSEPRSWPTKVEEGSSRPLAPPRLS